MRWLWLPTLRERVAPAERPEFWSRCSPFLNQRRKAMKVSSLAWGLLFGMALTGPAPAQPVPQNPNCPVNANAAEAAQDYMQMHQIEADFHQAATDHNMDLTTSHGRLMLTVLGRLAEFERDLIRKRTTEGR